MGQGYYYDPEEAIRTVRYATTLGLVLDPRMGSVEFQRTLKGRVDMVRRSQSLSRIYYWYVPLFDPDRFLENTLWIYQKLVNKWTTLLWLVLAPGAVYLAVYAIARFEHQYLYFFSNENLVYLWITIGLTKTLHELAHAYSAKSFGLRVPQIGVAFLIFFPCLYCNTTEAWRLADRRQRLVITAAGIMAELVVAIISSYIWYFTRPGLLNSFAYYLVAVSFLSTVLFNGNPLLKFDGYFLLSDYLGIPNLASKSMQYLKYVLNNRVLGIAAVSNPASTDRETAIFAVYGTAALLYRAILFALIAGGIYYRFDKFVGFVLFAIFVVQMIAGPVYRSVRSLYRNRKNMEPRRSGIVPLGLVVGAAVLLLSCPVSLKTVYPCYLAAGKSRKVTVPLDAPVARVLVREGMRVEAGRPLFSMDSRLLELKIDQKGIDRKIVDQHIRLLLLDQGAMGKCEEKVVELSQLEHEIKKLTLDLRTAREGLLAPFAGWVIFLDPRLQEGFRPGRGAIVGEIVSIADFEARILVSEEEIRKIWVGQEVEILFPMAGTTIFKTRIHTIRPYAELDMKDSPFSSRMGGEIATEPRSQEHLDAPVDPQYVCIAAFENQAGLPLRIAGRCAVPSPPQSILSRAFQSAIQTINRESIF